MDYDYYSALAFAIGIPISIGWTIFSEYYPEKRKRLLEFLGETILCVSIGFCFFLVLMLWVYSITYLIVSQ